MPKKAFDLLPNLRETFNLLKRWKDLVKFDLVINSPLAIVSWRVFISYSVIKLDCISSKSHLQNYSTCNNARLVWTFSLCFFILIQVNECCMKKSLICRLDSKTSQSWNLWLNHCYDYMHLNYLFIYFSLSLFLYFSFTLGKNRSYNLDIELSNEFFLCFLLEVIWDLVNLITLTEWNTLSVIILQCTNNDLTQGFSTFLLSRTTKLKIILKFWLLCTPLSMLTYPQGYAYPRSRTTDLTKLHCYTVPLTN